MAFHLQSSLPSSLWWDMANLFRYGTAKFNLLVFLQFIVVQKLSHVWPSTPSWTAARQAPLSSTISRSLLKFTSIDFCLFILSMEFSRQECWSGFPFSPPMTFCQNSPLWPIRPGWPCTAWLIASLRYASPFTMTRLWSIKGFPSITPSNDEEWRPGPSTQPQTIVRGQPSLKSSRGQLWI